jgi:phosphate transport system protein
MAGRVEQMIARAVRAVAEQDAELAAATAALDVTVDEDEVAIDELCLSILARRQPLGSDLRFVALALKIVTDLERIGDLASNVCRRAEHLSRIPRYSMHDGIARMAEGTQHMVHGAITALVERDAEGARQVLRLDDAVDDDYVAVFRDVLQTMQRHPTLIEPGLHAQTIAKLIERMADHATNIAEQVIFYTEGRDVRHGRHR